LVSPHVISTVRLFFFRDGRESYFVATALIGEKHFGSRALLPIENSLLFIDVETALFADLKSSL